MAATLPYPTPPGLGTHPGKEQWTYLQAALFLATNGRPGALAFRCLPRGSGLGVGGCVRSGPSRRTCGAATTQQPGQGEPFCQ